MELTTDLASRETERLRRSFRPRKVKILFIGESAPCSGKSFYRESGMTAYTKEAFEDAFGVPFKSTAEFLHFFKAQGCYLDDLSLVPVDGMSKGDRRQSLVAGVPALAHRIRMANPDVVVVVLRKIESHVREALVQAGIEVPTYVLPSPGQGHQAAYRTQLSGILKDHLRRPV